MKRIPVRAVAAAALLSACGGRPGTPVPASVDPVMVAEVVAATAVKRPLEIVFDWRLREREARFSGQGVVRVEPDRARLDLFGPRGEGYVSAVLDGLELQLPPGVENVPLPPPPLFWTVLGSLREPPGAALAGTRRANGRTEIEYAAGTDVWRFHLTEGALRSAEWTGAREGRRTVELGSSQAHGVPREATYRDWPAFLELTLELKEVREVDAFPAGIWTLRGS